MTVLPLERKMDRCEEYRQLGNTPRGEYLCYLCASKDSSTRIWTPVRTDAQRWCWRLRGRWLGMSPGAECPQSLLAPFRMLMVALQASVERVRLIT